MRREANPTMRFQGLLEPDHTALHWVIVRLPFDPVATWPVRKNLRVTGSINGHAFRTSLFSTSDRGYVLMVNRKMQKSAGIAPGSRAAIELTPDLEERSAAIPSELARLLKQDRELKKWYSELSYSMRKDIEKTIHEPKSAEARTRRAEQLAERMLLAMEGEHQVPPILELAFLRQPLARAGWQAMTRIQRRGHLLGIFGCQSIEARRRRAEKAVAECLRFVHSKQSRREPGKPEPQDPRSSRRSPAPDGE